MKRLSLLVLAAALLVSSCATLKAHDPFRNPDGTINVEKILTWAQYGIDADCQIGTNAIAVDICHFGTDAINAAQAALAKDPKAGAAVARQSLIDTGTALPPDKLAKVAPYLNWAISKLGGQS
jgi:hypothetical protein